MGEEAIGEETIGQEAIGQEAIGNAIAAEARIRDEAQAEGLRVAVYRLLAALLAAPANEALLERLRSIEPDPAEGVGNVASLDIRAAGEMHLASAWRALGRAARAADAAAVDDEYHELFIGLGRGELVPFGSWYLSGALMDRPLVALRSDLAALGIEREPGVKEPEDHAAALLETMGLLIEADDVDARRQARFFDDHVGAWMGAFFRDLRGARSAVFYRAVGELGERFIELESEYLGGYLGSEF